MADQLEILKQLQTLDGELFRLRREQEEKPRELEQAATRVVAQEAQLKAAEARLTALQLTQKEKEMELIARYIYEALVGGTFEATFKKVRRLCNKF